MDLNEQFITSTAGLPVMQSQREMSFDDETLEKMTYLTKVKREGNISDICNKALKEFLEVKFKDLKLEHFIDPIYEAGIIALQNRLNEEAKARDDARLLIVAKARVLEKEVEKIREEQARIREEEKRTGIKVPKEEMVKVEMLKLVQGLSIGTKTDAPKSTAIRWQQHGIAKII